VPGGRNSRIDEIQAAVLAVLLPSLAARNDRRRAIHAHYVEALGDRLEFVDAGPGSVGSVAHLCVARSSDRDRLISDLATEGVAAAVHYPLPDHLQPVLAGRPFRHDDLGETERACREVVSLPCFPELGDHEVEHVVDVVKRFA
jgi:dTDP-4-amino-4,6-dideoxygalactose transaminase